MGDADEEGLPSLPRESPARLVNNCTANENGARLVLSLVKEALNGKESSSGIGRVKNSLNQKNICPAI